MDRLDLVKLAADFSAGAITAEAIKEVYGENILSAVLSLASASVVGVVTNTLIDVIEKETGIFSDAFSVVDDVFSIFD